MQFPVVNLNGTDGAELLFQNMQICRALKNARAEMQAYAPHGRDYQTAPKGAYETARQEFFDRMVALDKLIADYTAITENLYEQVPDKDKMVRKTT